MSPAIHLLASWALADRSGLGGRGAALAAWAGVAPDLDGLGAVADVAAKAMHLGDPGLYHRFHHVLLHGIFGALLLSALAWLASGRKMAVLLWSLAIIHVHLLCDLAGSRGPSPDDVWPVPYLAPFSDALTMSWKHQWPLNAWPNVLLAALLLGYAIHRAAATGRSPVIMFSAKWNDSFVGAVRARLKPRWGENKPG